MKKRLRDLSLEERTQIRQAARARKYVEALPAAEKTPAKMQEALSNLVIRDKANPDGSLTAAGRLELHQLDLLKWWVDHHKT